MAASLKQGFLRVNNSVLQYSKNGAKLSQNLRLLSSEVTHTGQCWDKEDYRNVRFENAPRQINPRFAIDLIAEVPPKPVKARVVWCDGGNEALGHPKVYINLDPPGPHTCGYCGLRYIKEDSH